jgi:folate-binding protein YgfZ
MYQLLNISGTDADLFLQGQLTQDIARLQSGTALPAAWCTPKGRVVATMSLLRSDDGIRLLLPAGIATTFLQRISIYKFRADVRFELQPDMAGMAVRTGVDIQRLEDSSLMPDAAVNSCRSNGPLTAICIATDPLVIEVFGPADKLQELGCQHPLDEAEWRSILIRAGVVRISADNSEKYTPHMISLDLAGAVSFDKGCYTGQEIVARTEHRGKSRRRLARYECDFTNIAVGDELFDGDQAVGIVVNTSGADVLAVTPADIHDKVLSLNDAEARPVTLPWHSN